MAKRKKDEGEALALAGLAVGLVFLLLSRRASAAPATTEPDEDDEPEEDEPEPEPDPEPRPFDGGGIKPIDPEPTPIDPDWDRDDRARRRFDEIYSDDPTLGAFYQVREGDNGYSVVKRALSREALATGQQSLTSGNAQWRLLRLMADPEGWNAALYGSTGANPNNFPTFDDLHIGRAWMPWHRAARRLLRSGSAVRSNLNNVGNRKDGATGRKYGLVWIPSITVSASGKVEPGLPYADGSPATMPPPDFRELLSGPGVK